jgi:transcriptional regulator GlxA family with amidase domain
VRRLAIGACVVLAASALAVGAALTLLPSRAHETAVDAPPAERARLLAELRPPKHARPLVAVLAHNDGTETTDFVVPYGVLRESDAADVLAVALRDEPVTMMPALRIRAQLDVAAFDRTHPEGADYVIVPAMHHADDPAVSRWLAAQARSGATIVGICDGAWVLGAAGLLDGRAATTHWFSRARLREKFPSMTWAEDRRYVADRGVVTTTGVSASIPLSLTLVEAIAGRERAEALARELGARDFGASHSSRAFVLDRGSLWTALANTLAFWSHETVGLRAEPGVDEVALALTADAYSRTYRTSVRTVSSAPESVSRRGLTILADEVGAGGAREIPLAPVGESALDAALAGIARRYGPATADFVALQLEYAPAR